MQVNIHEARTRFSELIAKVEIGEEVTIARAGRPVARIVPIRERKEKRIAGRAKGMITIRDDFDTPLSPEIIAGSDR